MIFLKNQMLAIVIPLMIWGFVAGWREKQFDKRPRTKVTFYETTDRKIRGNSLSEYGAKLY